MALYSYEAFSKSGKRVTGTIDAASSTDAREKLLQQQLYPISIALAKEGSAISLLSRIFSRSIRQKDKILFTKQLAILLRSGVPLLEAMNLLIDQVSGKLKLMLIEIKDALKEGSSLANALAAYPKIFDSVYVQLIKAGEASGRLETVLQRLTNYLERRQAITQQIRGALQYPLIQLIVIIGAVAILVTQVIPQIAEVLASQGVKLPLNTRILMGLSDFLINHYIAIIVIWIGVITLFTYWKRTSGGKRILDSIIVRIPFISYIARTNAVVQFSYTLGILLEGGVNLSDALDIVVKVIDNQILAQTLIKARDNIIKQGKIADYLEQTNIFPPVAIYLIRTGEQSGNLDEMLLIVAQNHETELLELINTLTTLINPIMLVIMASTVGFIVFSVIGPVQNMGQNIIK